MNEDISINDIYLSKSFKDSDLKTRETILDNYRKSRPEERLQGHEFLLQALELKRDAGGVSSQLSNQFIDEAANLIGSYDTLSSTEEGKAELVNKGTQFLSSVIAAKSGESNAHKSYRDTFSKAINKLDSDKTFEDNFYLGGKDRSAKLGTRDPSYHPNLSGLSVEGGGDRGLHTYRDGQKVFLEEKSLNDVSFKQDASGVIAATLDILGSDRLNVLDYIENNDDSALGSYRKLVSDTHVDSLQSGRSVEDNISEFSKGGLNFDTDTLYKDASLAISARNNGKGIYLDSNKQAHIVSNEKITTDYDAVEKEIDALDITDKEKSRLKSTALDRKKLIVNDLFKRNLETGNVDVDDNGNPSIRPVDSILSVASAITSSISEKVTGESSTSLANLKFTDAQKEAAVIDRLKIEDNTFREVMTAVDRGSYGRLRQAYFVFGDEFNSSIRDSRSALDSIDNLTSDDGTFQSISEVVAEELPSVALTALTGGSTAAAFTTRLGALRAGKLGSNVAVAVGGLQSFVSGADQALAHDPSNLSNAVKSGFFSMGSEMLLSAGFNKLGVAGGVENFQKQLKENVTKTRSALIQASKNQLVATGGEGLEEGLTTYLQYLTTREYTGNESIAEIHKEAMLAVTVGSIFGFGSSARASIQKGLDVSATNDVIREAADLEMENAKQSNSTAPKSSDTVTNTNPNTNETDRQSDVVVVEPKTPVPSDSIQEAGRTITNLESKEELTAEENVKLEEAYSIISGENNQSDTTQKKSTVIDETSEDTSPDQVIDSDEVTPTEKPNVVQDDSSNDSPTHLTEGDPIIITPDGTVTGINEDGATYKVESSDPNFDRAKDIAESGGSTLSDVDPAQQEEASNLKSVSRIVDTETVSEDGNITKEEEADIISDYRDTVFETFDSTFIDGSDVDTKNNFSKAISNAKTATELKNLEDTMIALSSSDSDGTDIDFSNNAVNIPDVELPAGIRQVPVKDFIGRANDDQLNEFYERSGELPAVDLVTEIANRDGIENFQSDEDLLNTGENDSGNTDTVITAYSGLHFGDKQQWVDVAQKVFKTGQSIAEFSKKMVNLLGDKVIPVVRNLFNDLKRNKGKVTDPDLTKVEETANDSDPVRSDDTPINENDIDAQENEALKSMFEEAGVGGNPPIESLSDIEKPDFIPSIPSFGNLKESNSITSTPLSILTPIRKIFGKGPSQIQEDNWRPMKAMAGFLGFQTYSNSALTFMATRMTVKYKEFTDTLDQQEDGTYLLTGKVIPKEDGPQSVHIADVMESLQENPDSYEVVDPKVYELLDDSVKLNQYQVKAMEERGMNPAAFVTEDGTTVDLTKLNTNFYFPRGSVTHPDIIQKSSDRSNRSHNKAISGSSSTGQRRYTSEMVGSTEGKFIYSQDPVHRLVAQHATFLQMIATHDLMSDPDFRSISKPVKRVRVTEDKVDPTSGEVTTTTKFVKGKPLDSGQVRVGSLMMPTDSSDATELNSFIKSISQEGSGLKFGADLATNLSVLPLSSDLSFLLHQGQGLLVTKPDLWLKASSLSLQEAALGNSKSLESVIEDDPEMVELFITHLGDFTQQAEDFGRNDVMEAMTRKRGPILDKVRASMNHNKVTKFVSGVPVTVVRRSARAQGALQTIGSFLYFKSLVESARSKSDVPLTTKEIASIAKATDNFLGKNNFARHGVSRDMMNTNRLAATAMGMYVGLTSVVTDVASKDPFIRRNAIKRLATMTLATKASYLATALAFDESAYEEEDDEEFTRKFARLAKRMIPGANGYMAVDIKFHNDDGSKTIKRISLGGFYRGFFDTLSKMSGLASVVNDGEFNPDLRAGARFAGGKKRGVFEFARQLVQSEDYFGNPSTLLETVVRNQLPISSQSPIQALTDPMFLSIQKSLGVDLVTAKRITENTGDTDVSVFDFVTNVVGLNGYVKGESQAFTSSLNSASKKLFKKSYDDLSFKEATEAYAQAHLDGAVKPSFDERRLPDLIQKNIDKFRSEVGGVNFHSINYTTSKSLAGIPSYSKKIKGSRRKVRIPSAIRDRIHDAYYQDIKDRIEEGKSGPDLIKYAKKKMKSLLIEEEVR